MNNGGTKRPWHERLLAGIPPMSDRLFALWFALMVLILGVVIGMTVCTWRTTAPHVAANQRAPLQGQIDVLEQRVRLLEQRRLAPGGPQ